MQMTSDNLKKLLAEKHKDDVFIPECKTGPSQGYSCSRMDAWTMNKSWANACATVYEIKVNRNDFLKDKKWRNYLDFCNEFYFVCPAGLISKEECPDVAGLLWVSTKGTMLYTKKMAQHREVEIPNSLYMYILMCRCKIKEDDSGWDKEDKSVVRFWELWLKDQKIEKELGWQVSKSLRKRIDEEVLKAKEENAGLLKKIQGIEWIEVEIKKMGLEIPDVAREWSKDRAYKDIRSIVEGVDDDFIYKLKRIASSANELIKNLEEKR